MCIRDRSITVLSHTYDGKRYNSPNDVVVSRDGAVWFTDPPFGLMSYYEGHLDTCLLYTSRCV